MDTVSTTYPQISSSTSQGLSVRFHLIKLAMLWQMGMLSYEVSTTQAEKSIPWEKSPLLLLGLLGFVDVSPPTSSSYVYLGQCCTRFPIGNFVITSVAIIYGFSLFLFSFFPLFPAKWLTYHPLIIYYHY